MNNMKNNVIVGSQQLINSTAGREWLWRGFDPYSHLFRDTLPPNVRSEDEGLGTRENQWTEILSWEPRSFLCHNFLSKEECEYLIKLATPHMTKSTVLDPITRMRYYSSGKTSTQMYVNRGRDKIIRDREKRIADFTFIPIEHCGGLHVIRYEVGQHNGPHYDIQNAGLPGGPQIATFIMYLSDVEEGGETYFPSAKGNISWLPWWDDLSEDGKKGLSVKPKMGDAFLFWSIKPDGTLDSYSKHAGKPVIRGNKWACIKTLHLQGYKV